MKKTIILAFVCITMYTNAYNENPKLDVENPCVTFAQEALQLEELMYGEFGCSEVAFDVGMEYYNFCMEEGAENMIHPIFLM